MNWPTLRSKKKKNYEKNAEVQLEEYVEGEDYEGDNNAMSQMEPKDPRDDIISNLQAQLKTLSETNARLLCEKEGLEAEKQDIIKKCAELKTANIGLHLSIEKDKSKFFTEIAELKAANFKLTCEDGELQSDLALKPIEKRTAPSFRDVAMAGSKEPWKVVGAPKCIALLQFRAQAAAPGLSKS